MPHVKKILVKTFASVIGYNKPIVSNFRMFWWNKYFNVNTFYFDFLRLGDLLRQERNVALHMKFMQLEVGVSPLM